MNELNVVAENEFSTFGKTLIQKMFHSFYVGVVCLFQLRLLTTEEKVILFFSFLSFSFEHPFLWLFLLVFYWFSRCVIRCINSMCCYSSTAHFWFMEHLQRKLFNSFFLITLFVCPIILIPSLVFLSVHLARLVTNGFLLN